jgi:Xaa-Pro dipeptidase
MGVGDKKIRFTGHGVELELDEFQLLESDITMALESNIIRPGKRVIGIKIPCCSPIPGLNVCQNLMII